jgi:hypothetical protein
VPRFFILPSTPKTRNQAWVFRAGHRFFTLHMPSGFIIYSRMTNRINGPNCTIPMILKREAARSYQRFSCFWGF